MRWGLNFTIEDLQAAFERATEAIRSERPPLDFSAASERAIVHRLALHLESAFPGWNVDCEYDRHGRLRKLLYGIKECSSKRATDEIIPDLLVHHRGESGRANNLLVVEVKKRAGEDVCDRRKLELLTCEEGPYAYQFGLFVNVEEGEFRATWYRDGKQLLGGSAGGNVTQPGIPPDRARHSRARPRAPRAKRRST